MPKKYSVEFKQRVVEAVIRDSRPIADVAREYGLGGLNPGWGWVAAYRRTRPEPENELSVSERERLKQLEQENRDLRMENELAGGKQRPSSRRSSGKPDSAHSSLPKKAPIPITMMCRWAKVSRSG